MILNSIKNRLLEIVRSRLDPTLFEAVDEAPRSDRPSFTIRLADTRLVFTVWRSPANHDGLRCSYVTFTPGFSVSNPVPANGFTPDFSKIEQQLEAWLDTDVARYLIEAATPNLWGMVAREHSLFDWAAFHPGDLTPFANDEKASARRAVAEFEQRIHATFRPDAEQSAAIGAQLKYLADAVERVNHFDWRSLLLSTVIGISMTLSLDTETGRQLFELTKQIFSGALKYLPG